MANIEMLKVEEQRNGRLLYNVRVYASAGKIEFPIAIKDQGTSTLNETSVLRSTLGFAQELEASARLRLGM